MNTPFSTPPRVMRCLNPDCKLTFEKSETRYMHFLESHRSDYQPISATDPGLASSFDRFFENKNRVFIAPPRSMNTESKEQALLMCLDADCQQTFNCENLRDFHYIRMHQARQSTIINTAEEEETPTTLRYQCSKATCGGLFLTPELRDLHCAQTHSAFWRRTHDRSVNIMFNFFENKVDDKDMDSMATSFDDITPLTEMSEPAFISDVESDATSICDSDFSDENKDVEPLDLSAVEVVSAKTMTVTTIDGLVIEVDVPKESTSVVVVECKVEFLQEIGEVQSRTRPILQYRSRSEVMMNRNALANPGASKWAIRN